MTPNAKNMGQNSIRDLCDRHDRHHHQCGRFPEQRFHCFEVLECLSEFGRVLAVEIVSAFGKSLDENLRWGAQQHDAVERG
jgi:hypothetical protein